MANTVAFEEGHRRIESRQYYVFGSDKLEVDFSRWARLKSIVMVENFRFEKGKKLDFRIPLLH